MHYEYKSRVFDQNGVSLLYILLEIHHSGSGTLEILCHVQQTHVSFQCKSVLFVSVFHQQNLDICICSAQLNMSYMEKCD